MIDASSHLWSCSTTISCFRRPGFPQGKEELRALFSIGEPDPPHWTEPGQLLKQPASVHVQSNPVIDVDGDTATAESDFLVMKRGEEQKSSTRRSSDAVSRPFTPRE